MNERFLRKNIYQVGQFYQIDSFNPVYLDKTGSLIAASEGILKNWNGNMNEFHFSDESEPYLGKVNMQNYWYHNTKQGDFDDDEILRFSNFINNTNSLIDSIYQPKYYTRIGFRIQLILKKTTDHVKAKYQSFFNDKFNKLSKYGEFATTAIGFDISNDNYKIRININYAQRNTDNEINAPKNGLLFDLDFYNILNKADSKDTFSLNEKMLSNINEQYKELICLLAEEMGII